MSYLALYREWRPRTFDEVVEQKHAVFALRQAVISRQIGHAYLFSGTRGTGKTTLAKIFSRAINCLDPQDGNPCNQCEICRGVLDGSLLDVVEMDAASNNSVDNIRRITDEVNFMPSKAKFKVYIIDEVHMLTPGAFNALLKTLEEPPAHAVFILATTEPHRIPATILSRCQRYDFRRIPVESITTRLAEIAKADGITIDTSGLETIAAFSDGALRDAISLLDQAKMSCAGPISRDDILALAGLAKDDALLELAHALIRRDASSVLDLVDQLVMAGRDLARLIPDLALLFRNLLICQVSDRPEKLVQTTAEGLAMMRQLAALATQQQLLAWIRGLSSMLTDLRWATDTRTVLEVGLMRLMAEGQTDFTPSSPAVLAHPKPIAAKPASTPPAIPVPAIKPVPESDIKSAPTPVIKPDPAPVIKPVSVPAEPPIPDEPPFPDEPPASDEPSSPDEMPLPDEPPFPDEPPQADEPFFLGADNNTVAEVLPASPFVDPFGTSGRPAVVPSAESAPSASTAPDEPADGPGAGPAFYDGTALWQKVLARLIDTGQMTLYLFGQKAKVDQTDAHVLRIAFAKTEKVHFDELRSAASQKILRECLQVITGQIFELHVMIEGSPDAGASLSRTGMGTTASSLSGAASNVPQQPEWMTKLQTTADTFGIPITMED